MRIWHPTNRADEEICDGLKDTRIAKLRPINWCKDDTRDEEMRVRELMGIKETEGDWE